MESGRRRLIMPCRPGGHHHPGIEEKPTPIESHACETW